MQGEGVPRFASGARTGTLAAMLRRSRLVAALAALAVTAPLPSTAVAVPVPLAGCAPGAAAASTLPCRPGTPAEESALAAAARSGADVLRKVLSTASFGIF
jgi:hypothetical protein